MGRVLQHIRGRITGLLDAWHGSIHAISHTNGYLYGILKCKFFDVTQRQSNIQNFVISHSFVAKKVSNQSQHSNAYNQTYMIIFQSFVFEGEQFFLGEAKVFWASLYLFLWCIFTIKNCTRLPLSFVLLGLRSILILAKDRCRSSFEAWSWPQINHFQYLFTFQPIRLPYAWSPLAKVETSYIGQF